MQLTGQAGRGEESFLACSSLPYSYRGMDI